MISIAFVAVKLQISKHFWTNSASVKWPFFLLGGGEGSLGPNSGPTLTPCFALNMAEIEKDRYLRGENSAVGPSKYCNMKALSRLNFPGKMRLLFALSWLFFCKKRGVVTCSGVGIKIWSYYCNLAILGHITVQNFWFQHFPVLWLQVTKIIFSKFDLNFQVWLLSLVLRPHICQKQVKFPVS